MPKKASVILEERLKSPIKRDRENYSIATGGTMSCCILNYSLSVSNFRKQYLLLNYIKANSRSSLLSNKSNIIYVSISEHSDRTRVEESNSLPQPCWWNVWSIVFVWYNSQLLVDQQEWRHMSSHPSHGIGESGFESRAIEFAFLHRWWYRLRFFLRGIEGNFNLSRWNASPLSDV